MHGRMLLFALKKRVRYSGVLLLLVTCFAKVYKLYKMVIFAGYECDF